MYLRCDGNLVVDASGYPACDNWVSVTTNELLGAALQAHKLSASDFGELAALTITIMLAAFGARQILKLILNPEK